MNSPLSQRTAKSYEAYLKRFLIFKYLYFLRIPNAHWNFSLAFGFLHVLRIVFILLFQNCVNAVQIWYSLIQLSCARRRLINEEKPSVVFTAHCERAIVHSTQRDQCTNRTSFCHLPGYNPLQIGLTILEAHCLWFLIKANGDCVEHVSQDF